MKLVDILARELKVCPEGVESLSQSFGGMVFYVSSEVQVKTMFRAEISEDWRESAVTRAQWQAAADALKAESSPAWVGVGLPPIGIDVEVFAGYSHPRFDRFIGHKVHIVAHDVINGVPVAVFRMPVDGDDTDQDYHAMVAGSFRPIRTPEQIAAEDRMNSAKIFYSLVFPEGKWHKLDDSARESWAAIYDAGYRKLEIVDN